MAKPRPKLRLNGKGVIVGEMLLTTSKTDMKFYITKENQNLFTAKRYLVQFMPLMELEDE